MKSLLVLSTLLFANISQASTVETWVVGSPRVSASYLTKADGSKIPVDSKEEVIIDLKFLTIETYGQAASREILSKKIILPEGANQGLIEVTLESEQEGECSRERSGEGYISMMGRHDAPLKIVGKIGEYKVRINSMDAGILNVSATDAKYHVNAEDYLKQVNDLEVKKYDEVFGAVGMPEIKGDKGCSAIPRETGDGGVTYDYVFPSYQTPGPEEGDILIKKEVKGSIEIKNFDMKFKIHDCSDPKWNTHTVVFTDAKNPKAKLTMSKSARSEKVSVVLEAGNRTCRLQ